MGRPEACGLPQAEARGNCGNGRPEPVTGGMNPPAGAISAVRVETLGKNSCHGAKIWRPQGLSFDSGTCLRYTGDCDVT